ncbi:hypothetical protein ABBQ38_013004 [Trebouxia sp. C0009 RCD-2024]
MSFLRRAAHTGLQLQYQGRLCRTQHCFLADDSIHVMQLKQLKAASRQAGVLAQQHHEPRMAVVTAANRPWYPCCFGTAACRHKVPAGVCAEFWQSWCLSCLFTGRRCLTVA